MSRKATRCDYIAGFCVVNDVSEREFQMEPSGQWTKGKGCDTFGPSGRGSSRPTRCTDPPNLGMWLDVNGETPAVRQHAHDDLQRAGVWSSYISRFMTLLPGDIISTGTPPGVGLGMKPPLYLKAGDIVTLGIQGLGEQRQNVVGFHR